MLRDDLWDVAVSNNDRIVRIAGEEQDDFAIYELALKVKRLNSTIPRDESGPVDLVPVTFEPDHEKQGVTVLYFAGDYMVTNGDRSVRFIRPPTRRILDEVEVPYRLVDPKVGLAPRDNVSAGHTPASS